MARKLPRPCHDGQPELLPNGRTGKAKDDDSPSTYQAIPSVWQGSDAALLELMLDFYPRKRPRLILDATVNKGRFWQGTSRRVVGMDIEPSYRPDVVADNLQMPFKDGCFDVVVYDPPHIPNQGKDRSKDFSSRFGLVLKSPAGGCPAVQDRGLHPQPPLPMGARRGHQGRCPGGFLPVRLHRQGPQRADHRPQVEKGPPRPAPPLLLAGVPQIGEMRVAESPHGLRDWHTRLAWRPMPLPGGS
jgi:hypothetical protein